MFTIQLIRQTLSTTAHPSQNGDWVGNTNFQNDITLATSNYNQLRTTTAALTTTSTTSIVTPTTSISTNLVKPVNIIESNSNDFTSINNGEYRQDDQNHVEMDIRNVVSTSSSYSSLSKQRLSHTLKWNEDVLFLYF